MDGLRQAVEAYIRWDTAVRNDIAAFEAWQREPDEDYNYEAIHVALLLSMEPYGSR